MAIRIFATTQFEGFHRWPSAPPATAYLRDRHRHVFHVRAELEVEHGDRAVEFITLKGELNRLIEEARGPMTEEWSCEHWASYLLGALQLDKVEVSEDGENGAVVTRY